MMTRVTRRVTALVAATGLLIGGGLLANAATSWKTFGTGWAVNRGGGWEGSPDIDLSSVTQQNPTLVRYRIKNHSAEPRTVQVYWDFDCWNPGTFGPDDVVSLSGNYTETIDGGKTIYRRPGGGNPKGAKYCALDVWVDYDFDNFGDNGRLTMNFQSQH